VSNFAIPMCAQEGYAVAKSTNTCLKSSGCVDNIVAGDCESDYGQRIPVGRFLWS
jgi:hypothetical protein